MGNLHLMTSGEELMSVSRQNTEKNNCRTELCGVFFDVVVGEGKIALYGSAYSWQDTQDVAVK